ncbi:MAG: ThuA domain-containing protein [Candidatus Hydrogenedentes bacterium]|nr:ThuA domain-containing protein [Candidatus Hydrogenedentota bacterium]
MAKTRAIFLLLACAVSAAGVGAQEQWVKYNGSTGPGAGKHIVLVSGDEEYRSEEALPQLGKILAKRHGFTCTVLFAINPDTGYIDPNYNKNIPGLEALDTADLLIIFTRFRDLPDDQMVHLDRYLLSGKPVIGLRTSTHAFKTAPGAKWEHYSNGYSGEKTEWKDGFGRLVLGEQWVNHHGKHKYESTLGLLAPEATVHPILRGIKDGDIWCPTDVYSVRLPLPGDSAPLVLGQVLKHPEGTFSESDSLYGMRQDSGSPLEGAKNDPMMPVAWTKSYQLPGGAKGKAFTTTIGASTDLLSEGARRLLVNAVYWCLGLDEQIPATGANVDVVGEYTPTKFEFRKPEYWQERKMTVAEHAMQ